MGTLDLIGTLDLMGTQMGIQAMVGWGEGQEKSNILQYHQMGKILSLLIVHHFGLVICILLRVDTLKWSPEITEVQVPVQVPVMITYMDLNLSLTMDSHDLGE